MDGKTMSDLTDKELLDAYVVEKVAAATQPLRDALILNNRLFKKLDEAMANPERIKQDTEAVGGFVSTLDLTETAEEIVARAIAKLKRIAVLEGQLAEARKLKAYCRRMAAVAKERNFVHQMVLWNEFADELEAALAPPATTPCSLCDAEQPLDQSGNYHDMGGHVRQKCTRLTPPEEHRP